MQLSLAEIVPMLIFLSALSKCFVVVGRITEVVGSKGSFAFIISQHK